MEYSLAYSLARKIEESEEYHALKEAYEEIGKDPEAKRMLLDFRQRERELQEKQLAGEELDNEEVEKLQRLFDTIRLHQGISRLMEQESRLMLLYEDIQRILAEPLGKLADIIE
ncbi:MAG: YlbF family regulator [Thermicanus sp.]|nr:YlbF family regulator [Thermicanus sp.]